MGCGVPNSRGRLRRRNTGCHAGRSGASRGANLMSKVLEEKARDSEVGVASTRGAYASQISQSLEELNWIPRPKILALRRLRIETVEDLLTHFPRRHEDRTEFPRFQREESDVPICRCGEVVKASLRRFGGWKKIFEATLQESQANALSEPLVCRWFNLHYVQKMIASGQRVVVFGKPRLRGRRICIDHPEFEVIENDDDISIHFGRITPIYPATEGVSQRALRSLIFRALEQINPDEFDPLLPKSLDTAGARAPLQAIHLPDSVEELAAARRRASRRQRNAALRRGESGERTFATCWRRHLAVANFVCGPCRDGAVLQTSLTTF